MVILMIILVTCLDESFSLMVVCTTVMCCSRVWLQLETSLKNRTIYVHTLSIVQYMYSNNEFNCHSFRNYLLYLVHSGYPCFLITCCSSINKYNFLSSYWLAHFYLRIKSATGAGKPQSKSFGISQTAIST